MTPASPWILVFTALVSALATALLAWRWHLAISRRHVAERQEVRNALQVSDERLRQAVLVAGIGVFEHDHRGDTIYASPEFRNFHGWTPDEPVTLQMLDDNLHPDDRARVRTLMARSHEPTGDGRFVMSAHVLRRRDGKELWLESRAQTTFEGEGPQRRALRTVGALRDVTAAHLAEVEILQLNAELEQRVRDRTAELEATVRELEAFSYSVSHDLRAPLRGIDGFSLALSESQGHLLDETGRDFLRRMRKNAQRMGRLIDDMLKLASVTRGTLALRGCDLSQLANGVAANLREAHPERDVEIVVEPGLQARADLGLMKVVLENLIGNAWKYSAPVAHARVEVSGFRTDAGLAFRVRDNGVGFDMRHADKLFDPFHRLHGSQDFEGSGIGLATVRRIIDRHGGEVWAEAAPSHGASFYFTLGTDSVGTEKRVARSEALDAR